MWPYPLQRICNIIFQKRGGGQRPFGICSPDLVSGFFPYWGEKPYLTVCGLRRATAAKNCRLAVCESFRRFVGRPLSWYQQGWGWNTMLRHYCWQTEKTKTQELLEVTSHPAQQLLPTSTHAHPKLEPPQGRKKAKPDLLNLYALPQILKNRHTTANYRFRGVPHSNSQVM